MVTYTQEEVDELKRLWELAAFEVKTKEVLAQINKRLDESNNYKATIGKDVKTALTRLDQMEADRKSEIAKTETAAANRMVWYQDWWVRAGIVCTVCIQVIQTLHIFKVL
jgi:hypothetical protein